jgi:hypothetical protein
MKKILLGTLIFIYPIIAHGATWELSTPGQNTGIGTTSPNDTLGVGGNMAIGAYAYTNTAAPANGLIVQGNVGIGSPNPGGNIDVGTGTVCINHVCDSTWPSSSTANALASATTTVNVSSATAPTSGQVLTATSSTAATWQAASGGGLSIDRIWLTQANGTIAGTALSLPATSAPTPNVNVGSNVDLGILTFPASSETSGYGQFPITASVPASLVLQIMWRSTDTNTGHNVTWNWNYACSGTTIDPSLSSAGTVTTSALGTSNQTQISTITLTSPSCSANNNFYFQIARRGDTDSVTAGADVTSIRIHD